jgi:hypothetical protein
MSGHGCAFFACGSHGFTMHGMAHGVFKQAEGSMGCYRDSSACACLPSVATFLIPNSIYIFSMKEESGNYSFKCSKNESECY